MLCACALPLLQFPQCACPAQVHCDIRNENVLQVTEDRYVVSDMVRRRTPLFRALEWTVLMMSTLPPAGHRRQGPEAHLRSA